MLARLHREAPLNTLVHLRRCKKNPNDGDKSVLWVVVSSDVTDGVADPHVQALAKSIGALQTEIVKVYGFDILASLFAHLLGILYLFIDA